MEIFEIIYYDLITSFSYQNRWIQTQMHIMLLTISKHTKYHICHISEHGLCLRSSCSKTVKISTHILHDPHLFNSQRKVTPYTKRRSPVFIINKFEAFFLV